MTVRRRAPAAASAMRALVAGARAAVARVRAAAPGARAAIACALLGAAWPSGAPAQEASRVASVRGAAARADASGASGASVASVAPVTSVAPAASDGPVRAVDDAGHVLTLARPARRIVSLAPHASEVLFEAGAGASLVAVERGSVLPAAASGLPRLAAYPRPDLERVMAFAPDLVVVWGAASGGRDLRARLAALGVPVFVSEPRSIEDIASSVERLGLLAGEGRNAGRAASELRERSRALRARHAARTPVPVFVQVWSSPLMTLSDRDVIGDALGACGSRNVFGDLPAAASQVDVESVLLRDPRVIVSFDGDAGRAPWRRLGVLAPRGGVAYVPVDVALQRPTPRLLDELERVCAAIDDVREAAQAGAAAARRAL